MRRRVAIYGATEEALRLLPQLLSNRTLDVSGVHDLEAAEPGERVAALPSEFAETVRKLLATSAEEIADDPALFAVIDAAGDFSEAFPEVQERGVQIVTPLVARLLWCYGAGNRKKELLQALQEVVDSYNLTVDPEALFRRMLEIALGVTGAEGGSLMLLDEETQELRVRVAVGIEPELWGKIRVPLGDGIAGRVAEDARSLRLAGKADRETFHILRDRLDVESALCVPLLHDGRTLGVLNLHHGTRRDAFDDADLAFTERLARLDAQIIARAQTHESIRNQATRYAAVREVQAVLTGRGALPERLARLCRVVRARSGSGIVHLYLHDHEEGDLHLAASSLDGADFGEEVRVDFGQGIDGEVARTREAVILRTRSDLAYAALPLIAGDALMGVLTLQAGGAAPGGSDFEQSLTEVAAATAEALAGLRRDAQIHTRALKLGAINEAGIRIMGLSEPAAVLRHGTSAAAMALESDHAVLRLRDEDTHRYAIRSYFGSADGEFQERLFRLDKRVSVAILSDGSSQLVQELAQDQRFAEFAPDVRSLMAAPIRRDDTVIGTLALYDKMTGERFTPRSFTEGDLDLFAKFVSNLEQAIANVQFIWRARQFRSFDEATGLPNRNYVDRRLREEIARSSGRQDALAVTICRIENHDEIRAARGARFGQTVVQRVAKSLGSHLRDFDVVGRTGEAEFAALLPDPGPVPGERVSDLARNLAEDVSKDDALNDPVRIILSVGYAVYPEAGEDAETLLENASEPRIRTV